MKTVFKISVIFTLFILFSCTSDDDSNDETMVSNAELLVGTWQLETRLINDTPQQLNSCEMLESISFTEALGYRKITRSGTNCETSTQMNGTYELNQIETNFIVIGEGFSFRAIIRSIDENNLTLTYDESEIEERFSKI